MKYKLTKNIDKTISTTQVIRISDGAFIPFDEANTEYQEYLEWVVDGNTPKEADEA